MAEKGLTPRQEKWAIYFAETGNGAEAARRAGYSEKYANRMGNVNLNNPMVMAKVQEYIKKIESESIAKSDEVLQYLTRIMRGEIKEEIVVVEGCGDGVSEARTMEKELQVKDRIRAAELLGKRYGIFKEGLEITEVPKVVDDIG